MLTFALTSKWIFKKLLSKLRLKGSELIILIDVYLAFPCIFSNRNTSAFSIQRSL